MACVSSSMLYYFYYRWKQQKVENLPGVSVALSAKYRPRSRPKVSPRTFPEYSTNWLGRRAYSKCVSRTLTTTRTTTTSTTAITTASTGRGSGPCSSSTGCWGRSSVATRCHPNYLRRAKRDPPKSVPPCPTLPVPSDPSSRSGPSDDGRSSARRIVVQTKILDLPDVYKLL